jgi:hypothetical protein
MRRVNIAKQSDMPDVGVPVVLQIVDGKIEAVVIGDLQITKASEYATNLKITKSEPPKTRPVYFVEGTNNGFEIKPVRFEDKYDADQCSSTGDELTVRETAEEYFEDTIG